MNPAETLTFFGACLVSLAVVSMVAWAGCRGPLLLSVGRGEAWSWLQVVLRPLSPWNCWLLWETLIHKTPRFLLEMSSFGDDFAVHSWTWGFQSSRHSENSSWPHCRHLGHLWLGTLGLETAGNSCCSQQWCWLTAVYLGNIWKIPCPKEMLKVSARFRLKPNFNYPKYSFFSKSHFPTKFQFLFLGDV